MLIKKWDAKVKIYVPLFYAAHGLFLRCNGEGRAGIFADAAVLAKSICAVIASFGKGHGRVCQNGCKAE